MNSVKLQDITSVHPKQSCFYTQRMKYTKRKLRNNSFTIALIKQKNRNRLNQGGEKFEC